MNEKLMMMISFHKLSSISYLISIFIILWIFLLHDQILVNVLGSPVKEAPLKDSSFHPSSLISNQSNKDNLINSTTVTTPSSYQDKRKNSKITHDHDDTFHLSTHVTTKSNRHHVMEPQLTFLPAELKMKIMKSLSLKDLTNIRTTGKELNDFVTKEIFNTDNFIGTPQHPINSIDFCQFLHQKPLEKHWMTNKHRKRIRQFHEAMALYITWDVYYGCRLNQADDLLNNLRILSLLGNENSWKDFVFSFTLLQTENLVDENHLDEERILISFVDQMYERHPLLERLSLITKSLIMGNKSLTAYAVEHYYTDLLETLIARRIDLNTLDCQGNSILHIAVQYGYLDLVQRFVKEGLNPDHPNNDHVTPLMKSIYSGTNDVSSYLVSVSAKINAQDKDGRTALMYAVERGDKKIVEAILCKSFPTSPDVTLMNNHGETALLSSINYDQPRIFKLLVEKGNVNLNELVNEQYSPFMYAISWKKWNIVEAFLDLQNVDFDIDITDEDGANALILLSRTDTPPSIFEKFIVKKSPNLDFVDFTDGMTPLHFAAKHGRFENVKLLLKYGADPLKLSWNERGVQESALDLAIRGNHSNLVPILKTAMRKRERQILEKAKEDY